MLLRSVASVIFCRNHAAPLPRYDVGIYLVDVFVLDRQCKIESVSISRGCDRSQDLQCVGCEVLDCAALSLATSSRASGSANRLLVWQRPRAAAHLTGISRVGEIASPVERASLPAPAARQLNGFTLLASTMTAVVADERNCSMGLDGY